MVFGGVREDVGNISQTDYGYTGQRNLDSGIGLMDYKARFYSPYLNRFIQPDTIIPDPSNPQDWNRYSYVGNRPVNLNDPTGHTAVIPLFYIGIAFFAAVALAVTAYAYSNDPNFRDAADQTVAMATTGLERMQRGQAEQNAKKQDQFASSFSNNGNNTGPRGNGEGCRASLKNSIECAVYIGMGLIFLTIAAVTGGHNQPESNSHDPLKIETFTPTPTIPANTSTPLPTTTPTNSPLPTTTSTRTPAVMYPKTPWSRQNIQRHILMR